MSSLASDEALEALRRKLTEQPTQDDIWVRDAEQRIRSILLNGEPGTVDGTLRVLMDQARRPVKANGTIDLTVNVKLDPVPGTFHDPESARDVVQLLLEQSIPHYEPVTTLDTAEPISQPELVCGMALGRGAYCTEPHGSTHVHVKPPFYRCDACEHSTDDYNDAHFDYPAHNRVDNTPITRTTENKEN